MLYGFVQSQFIVKEVSDLLLANVQLSRNSGIPISPVEVLVSTSDVSAQSAHY